VGGPSSFFSRSLLDRVGGIDENLHYLMDIDLWNRFYFLGKQKYIRTVKYVWGYRIHKDSKMSGSDVSPEKHENLRNRVLAEGEFEKILAQFGKSRRCGKIANCLSISCWDYLIVRYENRRKKGCGLDEITR
jgi:GT2 family glycosyltransferase